MVPANKWWEQLPEDFYLRGSDTAIDREHVLKVYGSAALDRVLRTGLGTMIVGAMTPRMISGSARARERALMHEYAAYADRGNVDAVFRRPPREVPVTSHKIPWYRRGPKNIPCRSLSFESPFQPLLAASGYGPRGRNATAHAQYWFHNDGPRPTLILLHGYCASSYSFNNWFFSLPWFYRQGYDILICQEPFHGERADSWHPWSGYGYFAGGFSQTNEAMLHAISDVRVWIDYLMSRGVPHVGVSGYSLGGYITSMLAGVEDQLAFAIPNSPVVNVFDMAMEWQPVRPFLRGMMRLDDINIRELRHGMALHSPLTYAPRMDPERLLIISGAGDRFTSPRFVSQLHEHWPGSQMHWFPGNHLLHFRRGAYLRLMKRFMDRHCGLKSH
ncbi:MAG: alpha/beta hydrolase family protein [Stenotrophobium sp.]